MMSARSAALGLVVCLHAAAAGAEGLRAHEAVYHLAFKGIGAGDLTLTLEPGAAADSWVYETRAQPSFLARLVVSADSRERCWFRVGPDGVEPTRYLLDDGTREHKDDAEVTYDRTRGRVTGFARGAPLDLPLEPGLQDVLSVRIAPVADLAAGREPREYALLDGREVKHYVYTRIGTERIATALGTYDTVVYDSDRKGADGGGRSWRYWFAPALGWLPLRAEQREAGRTRLALNVRSLRWLQPAPAAPPRPPTG